MKIEFQRGMDNNGYPWWTTSVTEIEPIPAGLPKPDELMNSRIAKTMKPDDPHYIKSVMEGEYNQVILSRMRMLEADKFWLFSPIEEVIAAIKRVVEMKVQAESRDCEF